MTGEFVTITIQKMAFSIQKAMPTIEKWFLPPKNGSYHPPNDSYHRRTVPTAAEPSVPTAERFV
ncbi:MAG: hypothetical protein KDJ97_19200, partial [Anaerolineae bacterium]|nr:hypothetical protein [Anaerolineae bacterium]